MEAVKLFKCKCCEFTSKRQHNLNTHEFYKHKEEKDTKDEVKFICSKCNKSYKSEKYYLLHEKKCMIPITNPDNKSVSNPDNNLELNLDSESNLDINTVKKLIDIAYREILHDRNAEIFNEVLINIIKRKCEPDSIDDYTYTQLNDVLVNILQNFIYYFQ